MRKIFFGFLSSVALLLLSQGAHAACTLTSGGLSVTTQPGTTNTNNPFSMSLDSNGNCSSNMTDSALFGGSGGSFITSPLVACNTTATYNASTSGLTQIVAGAANQAIYVCGYAITVGTTTTSIQLEYGYGTNCATNTHALTAAYQLPAGANLVDHTQFWNGIKAPSDANGEALCVNNVSGQTAQVTVYVTQFSGGP
jgi:hypothetical protein